jgi:thiamine biosynthesis lipoprotein ApbE
MKKILFAILSLTVLLATASEKPVSTKKIGSFIVSNYENVLGTSMEIKVLTSSEKKAALAESAALAEISRLNIILSGYDKSSEFSKWMQTQHQAIAVSKDLFQVLSLYDQWSAKTSGALNASAEAINQVWKHAAAADILPNQTALQNAVSIANQQHWQLDANQQTATHLSNSALKFNSFTKSYIIEAAANAAMQAAEVDGLILNIGGDLVIKGNIVEAVKISDPKSDAENAAPLTTIQVSAGAIATSGNYRRGEMIAGQWYSHIVDPRNGQPSNHILSATVVAPNATDAGALATAFNVLTPSESMALAATMLGVEYMIVTRTGEIFASAHWKDLQVATEKSNLVNVEKEWKNEVVITLELMQQAGFAKRPFAAIWVEDADKKTVKTIALWFNKPRWVPDMREWYRKNGETMKANPTSFSSITSATRSAGKYTLKWDGKDDAGNILPAGNYTIYMEVVREHGGYDLLHQEVECKKKDQSFTLQGVKEVSSAIIEFKKKS